MKRNLVLNYEKLFLVYNTSTSTSFHLTLFIKGLRPKCQTPYLNNKHKASDVTSVTYAIKKRINSSVFFNFNGITC